VYRPEPCTVAVAGDLTAVTEDISSTFYLIFLLHLSNMVMKASHDGGFSVSPARQLKVSLFHCFEVFPRACLIFSLL